MASTGTELLRVTVQTPDRRVDVALPERVPVATLLPALLAAGGEELADRGALHAGWVLRRVSGGTFDTGQGLGEQGVRDGDVLCLGFADDNWPELDYDDAVEAIALGARRRGRRWDIRATRIASIATAVALYGGALVAVSHAGPSWAVASAGGFAFAALLVAAAVVATRAYGDVGVGTLLGALSLPFAFLGGVFGGGTFSGHRGSALAALMHTPAQLAIGSVAMIAFAVASAVAIGRVAPLFVAGIVAGVVGMVDAGVTLSATPVRAAAVTLGLLALLAGLAAPLAARIGGLPRPPADGASAGVPVPVVNQPSPSRTPAATSATGSAADVRTSRTGSGPVDTDALFASVSRTDDALTGLLLGIAVAVAAAAAVLATGGGWPARLLLLASAGAFALRARMYAALRHRATALATAGVAGAPLIGLGMVAGTGAALLVAAAFGIVGVITVGLGAGGRTGERSTPYLGRLADLIEIVSVAAVVPLVCVVLGLYLRLRGLHL